MNAIECRGLTKSYPHYKLNGLNMVVPDGTVMGFVGPNGAGKSTTLRAIMGLIKADAGEITVLGHHMPDDQIAAKWHIGFASEDMRLYPGQTIRFHMDFMQSIFSSWDADYATTLLKRFDLTPDQKIKGLSHGQRVKAGLLMVFARKPQLLVFDEPTTGLDPVARKQILEEMMLVMEDEDRSILFSSHNTLDVEQISDHITFIDRGEVVASDDKETFLDSWRRLRLIVDDEFSLPDLSDTVDVQQVGHQLVLTTKRFNEELEAQLKAAGASINDVERLTLEEIFITSVTSRQSLELEGEAA